ncbi:MAG: cytochrome c biogenesis protein CcdA [Fibrobacterota bacterium]
MQGTLIETLQQWSGHPLGLLLALALGAVSAVASACCTLPAMGLLVGYSGTGSNTNRWAAIKSALLFAAGTVLALMLVGGIAGFIGQTAQLHLGRYWKLFAALAAIFFGLITLKVLPFSLSLSGLETGAVSLQKLGPVLFGLLLGGAIAVCSLPCNPGIFIVMGAAILQGDVFRAVFLLMAFAIGFSLPLSTLVLGISLGKGALQAKSADQFIRLVSGSLLLIVGFYFLITL